MLSSIVDTMLKQRLLVVVIALILLAFGLRAATKLSVDAFSGCHECAGYCCRTCGRP